MMVEVSINIRSLRDRQQQWSRKTHSPTTRLRFRKVYFRFK